MREERGIVVLAVVGVIALVAVATAVLVPTPKGSSFTWWNPKTWGTHAPATAVDKAQAQVQVKAVAVDTARDASIHAAHVEIAKAAAAQLSLPASPATDLDRRFTGNALGQLDQADPLAANEQAQALAIVQGLLGQEQVKRAAAEKAQADAEKNLAVTSQTLTTTQTQLKTAQDNLSGKEQDLRTAFDKENALANEMRNHIFLKWVAIIVAAGLALLALYLRMGLGSVGAGLADLQKVMPAQDYSKVVSTLDAGTDWLHQVLIADGKKAAQKAELAAQHVLGIGPAIAAPAAAVPFTVSNQTKIVS